MDAAANNNARRILERDVDNLKAYFGQFAPDLLSSNYGREIWLRYEAGTLHPESVLDGHVPPVEKTADLDEVMQVIDAAGNEEAARRARQEALRLGGRTV
jgi:RIO kinase 1